MTLTPQMDVAPSLEGLIAWLETQPADEEYDWANCEGLCLIGLYAASIGISWDKVVREENGRSIYGDLTVARGFYACRRPRTFGGALNRARLALATSSRTPAERGV